MNKVRIFFIVAHTLYKSTIYCDTYIVVVFMKPLSLSFSLLLWDKIAILLREIKNEHYNNTTVSLYCKVFNT